MLCLNSLVDVEVRDNHSNFRLNIVMRDSHSNPRVDIVARGRHSNSLVDVEVSDRHLPCFAVDVPAPDPGGVAVNVL